MKVVFAGPSIAGADIDRALLDIRPPAATGDLLRATLEGATVIGLVDGTFGGNASVWHKEILFALSQGVAVLGAASMGALRAAECAAFGMVPVGDIAAAYIAGRSDDDAWVALIHGPPDFDSLPLSEPLVDCEATIAHLRSCGLVVEREAAALSETARAVHFSDRTFNAVAAACLPPGRAQVVADLCERNRVSLKRRDALALIDAVRALPDLRGPRPTGWTFAETAIWHELLRDVASGLRPAA